MNRRLVETTALALALGFCISAGCIADGFPWLAAAQAVENTDRSVQPLERAPISITYIGNSGFLIESSGKKVLVDALYRWGATGYAVISYETRQLMEKAKPPFDGVNLVLATHYHPDHFDAVAAGTHLMSNPGALLVSTPQSQEKMRESFERYTDVQDRARFELPGEGERIRIEHDGITLEVINLHHGKTRPIENLGFLFEIGGNKILHVGDTEATAEDFQVNNLHIEDVDFAFIPYWKLAYDGEKDDIRSGVRTEYIVVMHMPPKEITPSYLDDLGGWPSTTRKIKRIFPNAIVFESENERQSFDLDE
jgi:L-ascorbate metabolism protein UlaG (beta-lactamase superfamily)